MGGHGLGREQNNGDVAECGDGFHRAAKLVAVDAGHHDVADDKMDGLPSGDGEGFFGIFRRIDDIFLFQAIFQVGENVAVVVYEQQGMRAGNGGGEGGDRKGCGGFFSIGFRTYRCRDRCGYRGVRQAYIRYGSLWGGLAEGESAFVPQDDGTGYA